ncbi:MAG: DNA-3-methyladenine glycosylase family protein [Christensenellaceae bacterium]
MIKFRSKYFNIEDTLFCGQLFRFFKKNDGYILQSRNKACYLYYEGDYTVIESDDDEYFYNYFDLERDYETICRNAVNENVPCLTEAVNNACGLRLVRQDKFETIFEFIISQNNNIPRIKSTIEKLCRKVGEPFNFKGETLYAFPTRRQLLTLSEADYKQMGFGYRGNYFASCSEIVDDDYIRRISSLETEKLKIELLKLKGVGNKVCDCISLFGFSRTDSFPVDTWVEKIYRQDFGGTLTDRKLIADYFTKRFKDNSGFYQQYLFYFKRGK